MRELKRSKSGPALASRFDYADTSSLQMDSLNGSGFFEWKRTGQEKRPFHIQTLHDDPVMFAGIWDSWRNRGEVITSCAIITT
jgi:hypothetical protein